MPHIGLDLDCDTLARLNRLHAECDLLSYEEIIAAALNVYEMHWTRRAAAVVATHWRERAERLADEIERTRQQILEDQRSK